MPDRRICFDARMLDQIEPAPPRMIERRLARCMGLGSSAAAGAGDGMVDALVRASARMSTAAAATMWEGGFEAARKRIA